VVGMMISWLVLIRLGTAWLLEGKADAGW
jgi:hypothetical protein